MSTENTNVSGEGKDQKVTFTDEQQEVVNSLIQRKQGEAAREVREQLAKAMKDLNDAKAKLGETEAELTKTKGKSTTTQEDGDKVTELKALVTQHQEESKRFQKLAAEAAAQAETHKSETTNVRKQVAIHNASSKQQFFNLEAVTTLTEKFIKWDDSKGRFVVLGDNGQERLNSAIEPMSLEEFYTEFAVKNPYLVRSGVRSGAGSQESSRSDVSGGGQYELKQLFGKGSNAKLTAELHKTNRPEYERLRIEAKRVGLI